jgi:hypothetical protein
MPKGNLVGALRVLLLVVVVVVQGIELTAFTPKTTGTRVARLDEVAGGLATAMGVPKRVEVVLVARNDLIVSVEPMLPPDDGYRVIFEQKFFDQLTDDEVSAALAHEIGHVWIYSHFPFLQTEALANEVALKVVSRKPLESLYGKLWAYTGITGNLNELLGPPAH